SFYLFKWSQDKITNPNIQVVSPFKKSISLLGAICSTIFILLLLIPASPAFLGIESRIALLVWIILGILFYLYKRKKYKDIPESELSYLILGKDHTKLKTYQSKFRLIGFLVCLTQYIDFKYLF